MAAAPAPKTSLLLDAINFASTVDRNTPYEDLTKVAHDAGWVWYLRQIGVEALQTSFLVHFDVMLGKKDDNTLSVVDTISVQLPAPLGPLSSHARQLAQGSLIHMFFGRLPPAPTAPAEPVAAASRAPVANGHDAEPVPYAEEDEGTTGVAVVKSRTPDGLPVFVDLFEIGLPGNVVAASVLDEIEDVLPSVTSTAALNAILTVNPDLIPFFSDLAAPSQRKQLKDMLDARKAAIAAAGDVAPRRRSAVAAN